MNDHQISDVLVEHGYPPIMERPESQVSTGERIERICTIFGFVVIILALVGAALYLATRGQPWLAAACLILTAAVKIEVR